MLLRAVLTLGQRTKFAISDVYCGGCHRAYEDVVDQPCMAADSRSKEHLRGGPIGVRRKRSTAAVTADTDLGALRAV